MHLPRGSNLIILVIALLALIIPVILLEQSLLHHTDGHIVFPLDNAFVDITVGRNLAFYQVWGVSKYAFQSASSSLLYPVALAPIFFLIGQHLIIPILINGLAAIFFLTSLQQALIRRHIRPAGQLGILLLIVFLTPLPLLVVSGTSYTLQLLFSLLFLESLAVAIRHNKARLPRPIYPPPPHQGISPLPRSVYLYGILMIAARYEDAILLLLACLLLLALRRPAQAAKLALISLSPVAVFGAISKLKGSNFLPNSLFLGPYSPYTIGLLLLSLLAGALLIAQYGRLATAQKPVNPYHLTLTLMTLAALPFITRNITVLRHFQEDSVRIYQQEYPLAAFVHRYYRRANVGVNDIGAVAFFSDGRKLDFTGIASADVARHRSDHSWNPQWADSLSRKNNINTVMVSDPWFSIEQFPRWGKVASWRLPDSEHSKGRTYSFYVTNQRDTSWILRCLRDYQQALPPSVEVRYY